MPQPEARKSVVFDIGALLLLRAIGLLPHRVVLALGAGVGRVVSAIARSKRRRVRDNLERAGVADPEAGSRRAGVNLGRALAEMAWMPWQPPERLDRCFSIEGADVLLGAVAAGRGVLLAAAHSGNWELGARAATRSGVPVHVVARELGTPRVERAIERGRIAAGVHTIQRGASGASIAAYRALRNGHVLACMMDRVSAGRRVSVPFVGARTKTPLGPLVLARRAGSAIVVGAAHRLPDGTTRVRFAEVPPPTGDPDSETLEEMAVRVCGALDALVRPYAEEWYWIYRRPSRRRPRSLRRRENDSEGEHAPDSEALAVDA